MGARWPLWCSPRPGWAGPSRHRVGGTGEPAARVRSSSCSGHPPPPPPSVTVHGRDVAAVSAVCAFVGIQRRSARRQGGCVLVAGPRRDQGGSHEEDPVRHQGAEPEPPCGRGLASALAACGPRDRGREPAARLVPLLMVLPPHCSRQEAPTPFRAAAGPGAHERGCLGTRAFSARRGGRMVPPPAVADRRPGPGLGCAGPPCGCCPRALTVRRVEPPPGRPVRPRRGRSHSALGHSGPARPPTAGVPSVRKGFPTGPPLEKVPFRSCPL